MTKDLPQDPPPVASDPVLINVLATARRFVAVYAEYLSAGASSSSDGVDGDADPVRQQRAEELVRHLQHAVFDLMAAVHEMNRQCTGEAPMTEGRQGRVLSLVRAAIH